MSRANGASSYFAALRLLDTADATSVQHAVGCFRDHLTGTWRILTSWGGAEDVCLAGLLHSVYGSSTVEMHLLDCSQRDVVTNIVGEECENIVYTFSTSDRRSLHIKYENKTVHEFDPSELLELQVVAVDMANMAEQLHDGLLGPAIWISKVSYFLPKWGPILKFSPNITSVPSIDQVSERLALDAYTKGELAQSVGSADAVWHFMEAARLNSWVGEPLVRALEMAEVCSIDVDYSELAQEALTRLLRLGFAWDKRQMFEQWVARAIRFTGSYTIKAE